MVSVSSLPDVGGSVFELDTQVGITQLLISVRASDLPADLKHEIRDLVFQYTNGGKDATVKRAIEQKIATSGLKPAHRKPTQVAPLPPPPLIGTFRSAPVFSAPKFVPPIEVVKPEPVNAAIVSEPEVVKPITIKSPVVPEPTPVVVAEETEEAETPSIPVQSVAPEPVAVQMPEPASVSIQSLDDNQAYLNRIKEIKSIVNERVGNPVHLVDIDNAVGREYMSALLEAMKKLNSGSSPVQAMQRLEAALVAVEVTLDAHEAGADTVVPEVVLKETPAPLEAVAVSGPVSVPLPVKPVLPQFEPVPEVTQFEELAPTWPAPTPVVPSYEPPRPVELTPQAPVASYQGSPSSGAPETSGWNAVPTTPISSPLVHSLAEAPPPKTPDVLPVTKNTEAVSVTGDIFYTEEVTEGLDQLLMEWSIFKKSGLFGTGPKGREHPLFKKIATLQIPLLLAGRFEGATQEIKQSITDYMNGWRYEQGIIYEPGEQFEHYLRRVIRHILDLQKHKMH